MTKKKPDKTSVVYKIHNAGYTYQTIGNLLGVSKQYVYELYQKYESNHKKCLNKTCVLCTQIKWSVKPHKGIPLCKKCYKIINLIRKNKWKREHEKT